MHSRKKSILGPESYFGLDFVEIDCKDLNYFSQMLNTRAVQYSSKSVKIPKNAAILS